MNSEINSREGRRRAVAWGLAMTIGTPIAPDKYEQALLGAFVEGELTLDEVLVRLEEQARVVGEAACRISARPSQP